MLKGFSRINLLVVFLCIFISCTKGDDPVIPPDEPEVIIPSNLSLNITIVGADVNNPNGDGSGVIQCIATATDAVKFGYRFGTGTETESISGNIEFTYTQKETNNYTVYLVAYSKTGHTATISKEITIFVTSQMALIWSDEFDVAGSPSTSKWTYDIGTGSGGWGNNEFQYYTNRSENVVQQNGNLVITAKKESYEGSAYTSTRLKTQGKFSFTYGKVEVRAKLPSGIGVWPAIWMLGDNITTVGWPACGEVDIMEYWGYRPNEVSSAMHTPSSFGNTVNKHTYFLATAEEEFHLYAMEWTSTQINFYVDDILHYTYKPAEYNNNTWPFNGNQFLILNLAIGGNSDGGQGVNDNIFPQQFLIDYVRVYQ